jgi:NTP pyrophosphatase (non-canonical NTP hydrolase)
MSNILTVPQYIPLAVRTASARPEIKDILPCLHVDRIHAKIGLITELGEFLDPIKRHIFYGADLDPVNLKEEIGDMLWYWALYTSTMQDQVLAVVVYDAQNILHNQGTTKKSDWSDGPIPMENLVQAATDLSGDISDLETTSEPDTLANMDEDDMSDTDVRFLASQVVNVFDTIHDMANYMSVSLPEIMHTNIEKLRARFPDKFTEVDALERDLEVEREILENG